MKLIVALVILNVPPLLTILKQVRVEPSPKALKVPLANSLLHVTEHPALTTSPVLPLQTRRNPAKAISRWMRTPPTLLMSASTLTDPLLPVVNTALSVVVSLAGAAPPTQFAPVVQFAPDVPCQILSVPETVITHTTLTIAAIHNVVFISTPLSWPQSFKPIKKTVPLTPQNPYTIVCMLALRVKVVKIFFLPGARTIRRIPLANASMRA